MLSFLRRRRRKAVMKMLDEALAGLPPDPSAWVEQVHASPADLHRVMLGFRQMEGNPAWKFFRAALARKRDRLLAELRAAPRPGERDRANELRMAIGLLESLLALPGEIEARVAMLPLGPQSQPLPPRERR